MKGNACFRLATWNVNSIGQRLSHVLRWIADAEPDVLVLQELKCVEEKFPAAAFKDAGYESAVFGQKAWNGVAILSRHPVEDVRHGLPGDDTDEQARYIEATIKGLRVCGLYLPNGNPVDSDKYLYKLRWMDRLKDRAQALLKAEIPFAMMGDYNIIPEDQDCDDPAAWAEDALFRLDSRRKFRALMNLGMTDAVRATIPQGESYTYWDYQGGAWQRNRGIRIDHILLSPQAADRLRDARVDRTPRGWEKASDHTPVIADLDA